MRNLFFGFLIILAAAVLTKNGSTTPSLPGSTCTVVANSVRIDNAAGKRIIAGGRYSCDQPGASGQWATVATQGFTASGAQTTRNRSNVQRTGEVAIACADGRYRSLVSGKVTANGKTQSYSHTSLGTTNPCTRLRLS